MEQTIKIIAPHFDDEDFGKYQLEICNTHCKSTLEFWGYDDLFREFGTALISFPKSINDTVIFQIGDEEKKADCFLLLKVFCYEPNGHSAIQVANDNKQNEPHHHRSLFYITTLPARLNELGKRLFEWNTKTEKEFNWNA